MTCILKRRGEFGYSQIRKKNAHEKTKAEIGLCFPKPRNTKDCCQRPEAKGSKKGLLLWFQGNQWPWQYLEFRFLAFRTVT